MRYIEIDGDIVGVPSCDACPFNYDTIRCKHPFSKEGLKVCFDSFPTECPLREVNE